MKWISKGPWMLGPVMTLILTGCGKPRGMEVLSAPKDQGQAGIIATCTSVATAQEVAAHYGGRYRILNSKRKMIEFFGVSSKQIQDFHPRAKTFGNKVYKNLIETEFIEGLQVPDRPYRGPVEAQYLRDDQKSYFPYLQQIAKENSAGVANGEGVVIAIIDTGVSYNHNHLSPNIYINLSDPHGDAGDNNDNDGNGFRDDYAGWDFINGDPYPVDDNGHGTHVAGLAAGTVNGVAPRAKILPVKVLAADGRGDVASIAAGILYATQRGADIINLSLGGPAASMLQSELEELLSSMRFAQNRDVLMVAAAGNGGSDGEGDCNDAEPNHPASVELQNVLAVAAVDSENVLTEYSNFGASSVDVAAPGGDLNVGGLLSTTVTLCEFDCESYNPYQYMTGTSMATPIVSGLAALLKSQQSQLSAIQIKNVIMSNVIPQASLEGRVVSGGTIDVAASLSDIN